MCSCFYLYNCVMRFLLSLNQLSDSLLNSQLNLTKLRNKRKWTLQQFDFLLILKYSWVLSPFSLER